MTPYLKGDTFLQTIILGIHSLNIQGVTKGSFSKADWHYKGYEMCFKSFNLHTFHRTHLAFFKFPSYTSQIFKELFSNMINIISRDLCEYFFRSWCSFYSSHVFEWFSPLHSGGFVGTEKIRTPNELLGNKDPDPFCLGVFLVVNCF